MGDWGVSSVMGRFWGVPKVAQVEEKTNFLTPVESIASRRFRVLMTLFL